MLSGDGVNGIPQRLREIGGVYCRVRFGRLYECHRVDAESDMSCN